MKKNIRNSTITSDSDAKSTQTPGLLSALETWLSKMWDATEALLTWLPWTLLLGLFPGLIIWQIIHPGTREKLTANDLFAPEQIAVFAGISTLAFLALCFGAHRLFIRRQGLDFAAFCRKVNRFALILLPVSFYFFIEPHIVQSHLVANASPFFTMLLCTATGVISAFIVYGIPQIGKVFIPQEKMHHLLPLLVVSGAAVGWGIFISGHGLHHHENLGTAGWDFGLYINTMWHSLHGDPLACSLVKEGTHASRHFDPILILISPVLLIRQGAEAEILVVFQVLWVASGIVPLYLLTTRFGRNPWTGVAMVIAYLLHPALHGPSIFEFHSLMLGGPIMLWSIHFLEAKAYRRFLVSMMLLLLCREDMAAVALSIALYALFSGKSRLVALTALVMALGYGAVVYIKVFANAVSYSSYFSDIDSQNRSVVANIVLTAVTNPTFLLKYMLEEPKIVYILKLLVPLMFMPLFAPKHRILYLFGLFITLLGARSSMFSISMPYSTWWLPFMFAALPTAIEALLAGRLATCLKLDATRLRAALIAGILLSALSMSVAYGIFWPNPSFRAGYKTLIRVPDASRRASAETVAKLKKMIPDNASVLASEHLIPHFSARYWIWTTENVNYRYSKPDYGIIWNRDLKFQKNRKGKMRRRQKYLDLLRSKEYERILQENGISVYKRKSSD